MRTRTKKVYDELSIKMKTAGVEKSTKQIRIKLKNLKSEYRKDKDNLNRSGRDRKPTGKFFDAMDEVLGSRPSTDPPNIHQSMALDDDDDDASVLGAADSVASSPSQDNTEEEKTMRFRDQVGFIFFH